MQSYYRNINEHNLDGKIQIDKPLSTNNLPVHNHGKATNNLIQ